MNVLLVCVILFALWRGYAGMKKGMVDEIRMLLSLVISLFVLSLAILLYSSVKEKNTTNIILSVLMLLITGLAARLVNLIFKSLSAIAHLPILKLLNSVLGIVPHRHELIGQQFDFRFVFLIKAVFSKRHLPLKAVVIQVLAV